MMHPAMKRVLMLAVAGVFSLAAEEDGRRVSAVTIEGAPAGFPLETRAGEMLDAAKVERDVKSLWQWRQPGDVRVEEVSEGEQVRVVFRVDPRHTLLLRKVLIDPPTPGINAGIQPGEEIDDRRAQAIAAALRGQLEQSGHLNAKVDAHLADAGPGRADLLINIDKKQAVDVGAVTFTGDLGVREKELRRALRATGSQTILPRVPGVWNGWRLLRPYQADSAPADVANLQSFYYKHGFFDAAVSVNSVDFNGSKARVQFWVESGPRYQVREFTLFGADGPRQIPPATACRELLAERRKAERAGVLDFNARIEVHRMADDRADLRATIERGPAYETGRITFRGNHKFGDTVLRRALLVEEGAPLDEMRLRQSLARLNAMGFFDPLAERDVVVYTPPGSKVADLTIWLKERKARSWSFSGPVGPMSVAGPLEFSLGSRLPAWGQGLLELSTYTLSAKLFFFPKPLATLIPILPNKRFVPMLVLSRPLLPGQRFLSGATFAPQLGWQGMLLGYGVGQTRDLLRGLFQSDRGLTPDLPVTIVNGSHEGTMVCAPPKTASEWARQIGGIVTNVGFSFLPF
jgi:outer membrane protein assembly factor BamA